MNATEKPTTMHEIRDDHGSGQASDTVNCNPTNVFTGPDSLRCYFDPDKAPPLPLVELPPHLNPYYDDGVRIYAKMMSCHPANNVKSMPGDYRNSESAEIPANR